MDNKLIYDVGANNGEDTEFYLSKGFKVLAIEANPYLANNIISKFSNQIKNGSVIVLNVGIANENIKAPFYINKNDKWSSLNKSIASRTAYGFGLEEIVEIECLILPDVFKKYGVPYYLKIDIEGFDNIALISIKNEPDLPKYISAECTGVNIIKSLSNLGYNRFKLINQKDLTRASDFGEDLKDWTQEKEVTNVINDYLLVPDKETKVGWFDLHGKKEE